MTIKLIPLGYIKVWTDPANVLAGPGPIHQRSISVFKRVQWKSDTFTFDTHLGMGGFMAGPLVAQVDVRVALKDADGVRLFLDYVSRTDIIAHTKGEAPAYLCGRVDVDDANEKYAWLNRTQIVGKGEFDTKEHAVVYEVYALE